LRNLYLKEMLMSLKPLYWRLGLWLLVFVLCLTPLGAPVAVALTAAMFALLAVAFFSGALLKGIGDLLHLPIDLHWFYLVLSIIVIIPAILWVAKKLFRAFVAWRENDLQTAMRQIIRLLDVTGVICALLICGSAHRLFGP